MSGIAPSDGDWVEFCHLNPSQTATDTLELSGWLAEREVKFRHRDGPAGDTVFLVERADYARAVELWAEYRGSADYILKDYTPPPPQPPPLRRRTRR